MALQPVSRRIKKSLSHSLCGEEPLAEDHFQQANHVKRIAETRQAEVGPKTKHPRPEKLATSVHARAVRGPLWQHILLFA